MRLALKQLSLFYLTISPQFRNTISFTVLASSQKSHFLNVGSTFTSVTTLSSTSLPNSRGTQDSIGLTEIGAQANQSQGDKEQSSTMSTEGISSWREKIEISIAKSRKIRGGNYVQIATVDPTTLEPRCRTVVFRGFMKNQSTTEDIKQTTPSSLPTIMKMITDKRSNKFAEVTNTDLSNERTSNTAEMVWWFAKSSEQYRIRGQLKFVGEDEDDKDLLIARKEQWGNLSDMAREQFYWTDPGLTFNDNESVESLNQSPTGGRDENGKVLPPPENFLLMLLYPKRIDYLRLTDNFRQIDDKKGNDWESCRVNP